MKQTRDVVFGFPVVTDIVCIVVNFTFFAVLGSGDGGFM